MRRKLIAVIACRNNSSRLYAKPLQTLDSNSKINIIQMIIDTLKKSKTISGIVLGISEMSHNYMYEEIAKKNKIKFFYGSDKDVLKRLVTGAKVAEATDVFRVTAESPFLSHEYFEKIWMNHKKQDNDLTIFSNNIDGMGFEIFKKKALEISHRKGQSKHRSELCDLYIRENLDKFKVRFFVGGKINKNYRLTVDNPEDLILCRKIFIKYQKDYPLIELKKIKNFLCNNRSETYIVEKFISKSKSINNLWANVKKIQ